MTLTLDQSDTKIRDLLLMGNSVDVLAEQGIKRGWTRADILRVASDNGWQLDPSGRIPRAQRTPQLAPAAPRPTPPAVAPQVPTAPADIPPLWRALAAGRTHPVPAIRKRADRLLEQLQDLAKAIEGAEEERKVRDRLAELDAEREQLRAQLAPKAGRKRKPIEHDTLAGYRAHRSRGEEPCAGCAAANNDHMGKMRAAVGAKS